MKRYVKARVTLQDDYSKLMPGTSRKTLTANVFINGSAATINTRPEEEGGADVRFDRITDVVVTEKGDEVEVSGRSEYLTAMGLVPEDQKVSILIKGGKCANC